MSEDPADGEAPARGPRRWLVGAVLVALAGGTVAGRVAVEGRAELELADRAAEAGDLDEEILHLGRAARWRLPLARHDERALERLMALGEAKEAEGADSRQEALAAYREARRAILATRSLRLADPGTFHEANRRIARLMAEQEREYGTDVGGTGDPEAWHLARLEEVPGPDPVRGGLASLAFLGWAVTAAGFSLRGLEARGRLRLPQAAWWGLANLALLVAWMVLLRIS